MSAQNEIDDLPSVSTSTTDAILNPSGYLKLAGCEFDSRPQKKFVSVGKLFVFSFIKASD